MSEADDGDLRAVAHHEAGHAVIGRLLGLTCGKVTIIPEDESQGYAEILNPLRNWKKGDGPKRPLAEIFCISLYAGAEAERVLLGVKSPQYNGVDQERATNCIVMAGGIPGASFVGDGVWERYKDRLRERAKKLVVLHRTKIERVAEQLVSRRSLSSEEVHALMEA
jgi:Peptidase family M41